MARPRKSAAVDLTQPQELTAGLIERLQCPAGKAQAFLRDTKAPALRVRVTPSGAKAFVFEAKLHRETLRRTIGDVRSWDIEKARTEANRLRVMVDNGTDPRELERQQETEREARKAAAAAVAVTAQEAWTAYLAERRPHWGDRHFADHEALARAGGERAKRGTRGRGKTIAGPIHPLLALPLRELDSVAIERWAAREAKTRATQARLALRVLRAFLGWCADHPLYRQALAGDNPAKSKKAREVLGRAGVKQDALLREQLPAWFEAVQNIANPAAAAYLQVLLLTGARPGEVLALRWEDVNAKWKGLTIRDKVEGERVIPLTPYVSRLLHALPRRKFDDGKQNPWLFSSAAAADGRLTIPRNFHSGACKVAAIEGLTLHGLRRSFKSLTEWLEIPAGVVAQIMGHKPSATAEKHYTIRPLDLLRVHHKRIEAWILEQAGLPAVEEEAARLRAVT
jgi:integrase